MECLSQVGGVLCLLCLLWAAGDEAGLLLHLFEEQLHRMECLSQVRFCACCACYACCG